jgi:diguanylate cyclase (GGDEF)-like protein
MVSQADGDTDFFVAVVEDISARRHAEGLASHDALTGLPNRRAMLRKLSAALDALSEADKPLAVAYLDLDRFKQVNDRLGHLVGDRCLVTVSAVISEVIRDGDALYRIAGDEFVLLLSGADVPEAERILARVQKAVLDEIALFDWGISVSAGAVVLAPGTRTSADEVIEAADRLMYAVKRGDEATRTVLPFGASMKPAAARS